MDAKQHIVGIFDRAAGSYERVDVDFSEPIARVLVQRAGIKPTDDVLDVGTGRGAALFEAARTARTVTGTDLAPEMVRLTRQEAPENVTVLIGDAEEPNFPAGSFDVVLANLVIFFLPDPAKALRNYASLLRPGGRVAFTSFGAEDERFATAIKALAKFAPKGRSHRNPMFDSPESITQLLADNGFIAEVTEHSFESRLRDGDHWLEWAWSHGVRAVLEQISPEDMPEATAAAKAEIEKARGPEGELTLTTRIRVTTAQRTATTISNGPGSTSTE